MEIALSIVCGALVAGGIYLLLTQNLVRILFGLIMLSNAVNLMIFTAGGLRYTKPPLIKADQIVPTEAVANALPQALILTAIVIGFAEGFLLAVGNGLAAGAPKPERVFSLMQASELTVVLLVFIGIPVAASALGPHGAYVTLGVIGVLAFPTLMWLPKKSPLLEKNQSQPIADNTRMGSIAILLLIALFLLNLIQMLRLG